MLKGRTTYEKALAKLETLCSRAEHSTGEIRKKLRQWGISTTDSERIIHNLQEHRFVDDARFAGIYVREKVRFGRWGRRKIRAGLMQKGLSSEIINGTISEIDEDEYMEALRHVAHQKAKQHPELLADYEGRMKLLRHLVSRGYEASLAAAVIRENSHEMGEC